MDTDPTALIERMAAAIAGRKRRVYSVDSAIYDAERTEARTARDIHNREEFRR